MISTHRSNWDWNFFEVSEINLMLYKVLVPILLGAKLFYRRIWTSATGSVIIQTTIRKCLAKTSKNSYVTITTLRKSTIVYFSSSKCGRRPSRHLSSRRGLCHGRSRPHPLPCAEHPFWHLGQHRLPCWSSSWWSHRHLPQHSGPCPT